MPTFDQNIFFIPGEIADISTASSVRVPITRNMEGRVVKVTTVLGGAITTGDAVVTVSKNTTSMGTITIANSSSAEGDEDTLDPTSNNDLVEGDFLKLATDGGSTNAVPVGFIVQIRR